MGAALVAALVNSACGQPPPSVVDAETVESAAASGGPAEAVDLSRRSNAELIEAADRALREGRLYAPAGDSAIEYWLEARSRDPDDAAVAATVVELQPYLLIASEQAIARSDFAEAQRLLGLIATSDPEAPALQRLSAAIAAAEADAAREEDARLAAEDAQRQRVEAEARSLAAVQLLPPQSTSPSPPPSARESPSAASQAQSTPAQASTRAEPPPAVLPRPLHQPPPRYPPLALNRRMEGAVQVAFTIRPDGTVEDTRVLSATPPGVFDRSALAAVASYRFEPIAQRMASTVTVRFSLTQ